MKPPLNASEMTDYLWWFLKISKKHLKINWTLVTQADKP